METAMDDGVVAVNYRKSSTPKSNLCCGGGGELQVATSDDASLGPITPDSNHLDMEPSSTPMNHVFDPLAPAPDKLIQASYCRGESRLTASRQLTFVYCSKFDTEIHDISEEEEEEEEERMLFENVYLSILEAIISTHTHANDNDNDNDNANVAADLLIDYSDTSPPPHQHLSSGVADTCPRAPVKPTNKLKRFDKEICRKLEF